MLRNLENINKKEWKYSYWCELTKQHKVKKQSWEIFTRPASKIFDKRRGLNQRLNKKAKTENFISKAIQASQRYRDPIRVNISFPKPEDEILSEIFETDEMYFPKIEIHLHRYMLVVPIFNELKICELDQANPDEGFIIVYYGDENLIKKLQLGG